jgi:oxalate decarboxylase/phosphoglucose isomerase-like protein (cupin superfamily)
MDISEHVTVFRKNERNVYFPIEISRESMRIGDVVYDTKKRFYGRITGFVFKEPGSYEDLQLELEPEPNFFVFPVNYN